MLNIIRQNLNIADQTNLANIVNNFDEYSWQFEKLYTFSPEKLFQNVDNYVTTQENCTDIFKLNNEITIVKCVYYTYHVCKKMFEFLIFKNLKLQHTFTRPC